LATRTDPAAIPPRSSVKPRDASGSGTRKKASQEE
jgi:hypothetical protein